MIAEKEKISVGILGATGMVGQRLITLLAAHPWFRTSMLAASSGSRGKTYTEALGGRWSMQEPIPASCASMRVYAVDEDEGEIVKNVRVVFCAIDADKAYIRAIEERYAKAGVAVISNNSAHRWTEDVPMLIPEINPEHVALIDVQKKNRGWHKGFIVTKPNCSIQSYVPLLAAWRSLLPTMVYVTTCQALSGAGKTLATWPEMEDNVIPLIPGEEEKSEREPRKILGRLLGGKVEEAAMPAISATCLRVPVSDGHLASVAMRFQKETTEEELISLVRAYKNPIADLGLPSAPDPFLEYLDDIDRPQTKLDRERGNGMAISVGRVRHDTLFGWKCVALSHNTLRGAAGGSVLTAEFLKAKGFLD